MEAYWLLGTGGRYRRYTPSEEELENEVVKFSGEIFGKNTIYINTKKRLTAKELGIASIPDGFLLDLSIPDDATIYIVEIEISSHDVREIAKQILTFEITYQENLNVIHDFLIEQIKSDPERIKVVNETLKKSNVYKDLSSLIYDVVYKQGHQYLIIIDKIKEALKKALNVLDIDLEIFELVTFIQREKRVYSHFSGFQRRSSSTLSRPRN